MVLSGMVLRMGRKGKERERRSGKEGIKQRTSCSESVQVGRETADQVRVRQVGRRGSGESVTDSIRGLREVEVEKMLKMRKIHF